MKSLCNQCGEEILPLSNYCSYCGAEAPRATVLVTEEVIPDNPIYCSNCSKASCSDSLFCSWCSDFLYERNNKLTLSCPKCGKKNRGDSKICSSCGLSLADWFLMKGHIAETLGVKENLTLHETMNDIYYHFIYDKSLTIGSSSNTDIRISCPWVSSKHATIDFSTLSLIDNNSSNGTYVNRKPERVTKLPFEVIKEFNVAGAFTFTVIKFKNAFSFRLTAILDEEECNKVGNPQALDELRKHYYIILSNDTKIFIRRIDGYLESKKDNHEPMQLLEVNNGFFYFSNTQGEQKNRLVTKKHSTLPVNWKIIKKDK